jgi:hypothetical protein
MAEAAEDAVGTDAGPPMASVPAVEAKGPDSGSTEPTTPSSWNEFGRKPYAPKRPPMDDDDSTSRRWVDAQGYEITKAAAVAAGYSDSEPAPGTGNSKWKFRMADKWYESEAHFEAWRDERLAKVKKMTAEEKLGPNWKQLVADTPVHEPVLDRHDRYKIQARKELSTLKKDLEALNAKWAEEEAKMKAKHEAAEEEERKRGA